MRIGPGRDVLASLSEVELEVVERNGAEREKTQLTRRATATVSSAAQDMRTRGEEVEKMENDAVAGCGI